MAMKPLIIIFMILSSIAIPIFGMTVLNAQLDAETIILPTLVEMPTITPIPPTEQVTEIIPTATPEATLRPTDIPTPETLEERNVETPDESYLLFEDAYRWKTVFLKTNPPPEPDSIEAIPCEAPILDGVVLCLESDSGILTGTNNVVLGWEDQSGNGNDLLANGEPQLIFNLTSGNAPGIRFDGINDVLENLEPERLPLGNRDRTVFTVVSYDGFGKGGVVYGADGFCNESFGLTVSIDGDMSQGTCPDLESSVDASNTGWMVQSTIVVLDSYRHYRDGEMIHIGQHAHNTLPGSLVIGAELNKASFVNMNIAAVLVYDRAISETERNQIESYLQTKYLTQLINLPPYIAIMSPQTNFMNATVNLQIIAHDTDRLIFASDSLPPGLRIDRTSGLITGTITADAGIYPVTIRVSDSVNEPVFIVFNWTVADPNNLAPVANAGDDILAIDSDADGSELVTLNGSASTDDKAIKSYEWRDALDIVIASGATAEVTIETGKSEFFTLTVYDAEGKFSVDNVIVTVEETPPNLAPVVSAIEEQINISLDYVSLQVIATDSEPLNYSASGLPDGLSIISDTGEIRGTIIAIPRTYPVIVSVSDGFHPVVDITFNWIVNATPVTSLISLNNAPVANAGDDMSLIDRDGDGFETIRLDGSASTDDVAIVAYEWREITSGIISGTSAIFELRVAPGRTSFELTVYDEEGESHSDTVDVTLIPINTIPVISTINAQTHLEGATVSLQIVASDSDTLTYSSLNLPAGLMINPTSGLISGTITAPAATYPVTVSVSDNVNPPSSATFNWIVTALPQSDIVNFTLIDADTGIAIPGFNPIADGASLNLATLPAKLSIIANTNPAQINGGVNFNLNNTLVRQATVAPYSVAGKTDGVYTPISFASGTNTLTATTGLDSLSLTFTVVMN